MSTYTTTTHTLGFPRIGPDRELKAALESYWKGSTSADDLARTAASLRTLAWSWQSASTLVPVGDFSLYDHILDMCVTLGCIPTRFQPGLVMASGHCSAMQPGPRSDLDQYFHVARGILPPGDPGQASPAAEMTKWFDTNYHYLVPEFTAGTTFALNPDRLITQIREARTQGHRPKPVILGPVTFLACGKARDSSFKLDLLPRLLPVYQELFQALSAEGVTWVQVDEPLLCTDLSLPWQDAFTTTYHQFRDSPVKLLLTTAYGSLGDNLALATGLPVAGLHVDALAGHDDLPRIVDALDPARVLSLGVINGRSVWKTDLAATLDWLEPLAERLGDRLWLAPTTTLLHVPVDLERESALDPELRSWLAFARQKLDELTTLAQALDQGRAVVQASLDANQASLASRRASPRVTNPQVQKALATLSPAMGRRTSAYPARAAAQKAWLRLPAYPTTTIGSFPQTPAIRRARRQYREGQLSQAAYDQAMQDEIAHAVRHQEALGLDVLVHGEPERTDMVEYFGAQLDGCAITSHGWVQSYGSRCVKPPLIYGDVSRPRPMTVRWATHAASLSTKPMKGMLTGPVTILNWSFVRDDQPRSLTCRQLALALRQEVLDLEAAGIRIIQIDEAALREGLPLRRSQWKTYLDWAVDCFRLTANGVADTTQIHTHMCYSEFNDIIAAIAAMDADVITIENSRSAMELLDVFEDFAYPNAIGPGVYDIHSPAIPTVDAMVSLLRRAGERIPSERLWVNPDCGLKTRTWDEVIPALRNMVAAANVLREGQI